MTTEKTVLARWSMDIVPISSSEEFRQKSRIALAELFTGFARSLLNDRDIDLATNHEIELVIESENLNQRLKIRLIKMDITEEEE
jgi:hypothetical protein